ncbi:hypothetical protein HZH66_000842 [Vespula vulgaris]|uniref:Uncharacterized protein n=1 Tax=Vespula vulgaris TaxID=7454 RepID=A0A834KXL8_VESVU|nr:hypothetical protein HZH66_000842 [Vespula vulgaris]
MNNEVSHTLAGRLDSPQPRQTPRLALSYGVKITSNCISLVHPNHFTGVTVESADRIGILAPKRPRAPAATVVHSQRENPPCCHSFIVVALYSRLQALAFWSRKLLPSKLPLDDSMSSFWGITTTAYPIQRDISVFTSPSVAQREKRIGWRRRSLVVPVVTPEEISRPTVLFEVALSKLAEPQRIALNYAQKLRGSREYARMLGSRRRALSTVITFLQVPFNRLAKSTHRYWLSPLVMQVVDFEACACQSIVYPLSSGLLDTKKFTNSSQGRG